MNSGKKLTFISIATATFVSLFVKFLPKKKTGTFAAKKWFGNRNIIKMGKIFSKASKKPSIYSKCMKLIHLR